MNLGDEIVSRPEAYTRPGAPQTPHPWETLPPRQVIAEKSKGGGFVHPPRFLGGLLNFFHLEKWRRRDLISLPPAPVHLKKMTSPASKKSTTENGTGTKKINRRRYWESKCRPRNQTNSIKKLLAFFLWEWNRREKNKRPLRLEPVRKKSPGNKVGTRNPDHATKLTTKIFSRNNINAFFYGNGIDVKKKIPLRMEPARKKINRLKS